MEETYVQKQYEDMALFIVDLLPISLTELKAFGYREFFRSLKKAQGVAKNNEMQVEKMKNKNRSRR